MPKPKPKCFRKFPTPIRFRGDTDRSTLSNLCFTCDFFTRCAFETFKKMEGKYGKDYDIENPSIRSGILAITYRNKRFWI